MRGWSRFVWPTLSRAEQAANPTTGTYGSGKNYKTTVERKSEGQLSAEDLHQASLLSSQLLMHLNAAATHCIDGKGDSAKPEIEKAQALAGIVRTLLPTTSITTTVKDAQGKEVYRDEQKVQDDQIPIFAGDIAVEVVEPLVEAKKDQAALKGLKLANADLIHTAVLADLSYIERKLARAAQLLNKPEEAGAQLALAQNVGVRFSARKEDNPLVEVQHALRLAERMVQEKKYEGAKANLQLAKLRLERSKQSVMTKSCARAIISSLLTRIPANSSTARRRSSKPKALRTSAPCERRARQKRSARSSSNAEPRVLRRRSSSCAVAYQMTDIASSLPTRAV